MPYADPQKQANYFREYGKKNREKRRLQFVARRLKNPEKYRRTKKRYFRLNRDKTLSASKTYYHRNKARIRSRIKQLRKTDAKRFRQYHLNELKNHGERARRRDRQRHRRHKAKRVASMRLYYARTRQRAIERAKLWVQKNHARKMAYEAERRAKRRKVTIGNRREISAFYQRVYTSKSIRCHWCKIPVPIGKRHVDHKHPLCKGGSHCIANFAASCASCNLRKHDKTPRQFMKFLRSQSPPCPSIKSAARSASLGKPPRSSRSNLGIARSSPLNFRREKPPGSTP